MARTTALLTLILATCATQAVSQGGAPLGHDDFTIQCVWESPRTPLSVAIPELAAASSEVRAETAELYRILANDLSFASLFRIVNSKRYAVVETGAVGFDYHGLDSASFDYDGWKSIGIDVVLDGSVSLEEERLHAEIHLHAIHAGEVLIAKRYTGPRAAIRKLAHLISDNTLASFGTAGVATTRIGFASDRDSEHGRTRVWLMDYDGADQRPITRDSYMDYRPRYGPDGTALSFLTRRTEKAPSVIAVHDQAEPLSRGPEEVSSFSWSPDGSRIAFSSTRDDAGNSDIYVMHRDSGDVRRWTDHPSYDGWPTWSPSGEEIAFMSDRTGSPQIFITDEGGSNVRQLPSLGTVNAEPAWSPSKLHPEIAYKSGIAGGELDIVIFDLATREERQLTSGSGMNESPDWSHDGRHIVFSSTRHGDPQIFIINRNGANERQLTFEGSNTTPSWSRHGAGH